MNKVLQVLMFTTGLPLFGGSEQLEITLQNNDTEVWVDLRNVGSSEVVLVELFSKPLFAVQIMKNGEFCRPAFMVDVENARAFQDSLCLKPEESVRIDLAVEASPLLCEFLEGPKKVKYVYESIHYPVWDFASDERFQYRVESNMITIDLTKLRHNHVLHSTEASSAE